MNPGSIVRCRDREWVVLPADIDDVIVLRPLTGTIDDVVKVHRQLMTLIGYDLPSERVTPASFPMPTAQDVSDATSVHLLWQAARLTLREGAAPLRSLGRISIRPRVYQFVPLLMALRLDPVRLLIADDVGVGKTIEALLIARELIDRGDIRRLAVLCPPYLCDQWAKELREKFNLDAVVIGSSTIAQLERQKPAHLRVYEYYPIQVISIDWVKSERNKHQFLQCCPELVIVDEAHGAADAGASNRSQQQRHQLVRAIAHREQQHLILLTATPHSGIESAFLSLLSLLRADFAGFNMGDLTEPQRIDLARHFVQRTRADITRDWDRDHCFPERLSVDVTYDLSDAYRQLFNRTYDVCSEIVRSGVHLEERKRRVRYWGALALLRCVMSSPAAAVAALENREWNLEVTEEEAPDFGPFVFETTDELTNDETPTPPIEQAEADLPDSERRRLRTLTRIAQDVLHTAQDTKLTRCVATVRDVLRDGFHPIVWCRYVATAEYVGKHLQQEFGDIVQVTVITGRLGDEERRMKIDDIDPDRSRVLVATDCLSEGVNLQEKFNAVLHYDLPWNPNRLEQREGRVDRYGQAARQVKVVRFYGRDNPIDGAVIEVLLDKARQIYQALGTYVPVPKESESVMQAVLNSLFLRRRAHDRPLQLHLFEENEDLRQFHDRWDDVAERERINRTRFAQRALKPEEVQRELEATDAVLGDPDAVQEFVLAAAERLGLSIRRDRRHAAVFCVDLSAQATANAPDAVRDALPMLARGDWRISFVSPTPEGAEYVGRNHRFVAALARYLLEDALTRGSDAAASRCGVLRTHAVDRLTCLLLVRVRYLVEIPEQAPLLAEEVLVIGYRPLAEEVSWLADGEALRLLAAATPAANLSRYEKREVLEEVLAELGEWRADPQNPIQERIRERIVRRAEELEERSKRIRRSVSLRVRSLRVAPQFPPDVLGLLVLQPVVQQ
ncbi:helicase-related protein [Roseiflexus sp.]|uniref:helicase-related protein n=1 Tax=Roseiflexus sp. TaxID=2562120 RepID=UPI00398B6D11